MVKMNVAARLPRIIHLQLSTNENEEKIGVACSDKNEDQLVLGSGASSDIQQGKLSDRIYVVVESAADINRNLWTLWSIGACFQLFQQR